MLTAEGSYTEVHLEDGRRLLVSKGLGKLHRCLPPALFHRCHDSYVVNLAHVVRLIRHGGHRVELRGGLTVRVARRRWCAMGAAMERLSKRCQYGM
jgi:two-component system LytT family response regulator